MAENQTNNENNGMPTGENPVNSIQDKEKIVPFSIRARQEDVDNFREIQHSLGDPTAAEVFSNVVTRYNMPLRTNEENARRVQHLEEENATLQKQVEERDTTIESLRQRLADAEARANDNAQAADQQQLAYEKQLRDLALKDNQRVVAFLPDCLKAVEAVAERESQRRNQEWSVSHVINFFIHSRFIKGQLNGDLKSLSDAECKKLGIAVTGRPAGLEVEL